MPIRILLAEDHLIVRQGLRALIEQAGMAVIGEASDGQEALMVAHERHPDMAVLDIGMPHLNGLETARRLREALPQTKVVLLTMHTEDAYVLEALQAGAVGYVLKTQAAADLVQAIRHVRQGAIYLSPLVSRAVVQAYLSRSYLPPDPLTPREREAHLPILPQPSLNHDRLALDNERLYRDALARARESWRSEGGSPWRGIASSPLRSSGENTNASSHRSILA